MDTSDRYELKRDDILQITEGLWLGNNVESYDLSLISDGAFEKIKEICDALQTPSRLSELPLTGSSTPYGVKAGGPNDAPEAFRTIYQPQLNAPKVIIDLYHLAQPTILENEDPRLPLISGKNTESNPSP